MARPPAWTVQRDDATIFLFGVRPGARDTGWITDAIGAAIAACDEFWRETPPEEDVTSSPLLAELGLSPDVPLCDRLDDVTRKQLDAVTEVLSIDRAALERLRPWVVAQLVQQGTLARAGVPPDQNMDVVLTRLAEEHGATVRYEFDVEGIIRAFGEMSEPVEADYLRLVLDAAEGGQDLIDVGFSAWLRGDRRLDELADVEMRQRYPEFYGRMIRERNEAWIPRIDEMLSRAGTRFVAVGCGHLAGPDSVLSLLRQVDCQVTVR